MKATLLVLTLLASSSALATGVQARMDAQWRYQFQQYKEKKQCLAQPDLCVAKKELELLYAERLKALKTYREVANAAKNHCSELISTQRLGYDPKDRYKGIKPCNEFMSYREAVEISKQAPQYKAQLNEINQRIEEKTAEVAALRARANN